MKGDGEVDLNVQEAWQLGYSGKGVVVTIMDDGLDHTHPDLAANYVISSSLPLSKRQINYRIENGILEIVFIFESFCHFRPNRQVVM